MLPFVIEDFASKTFALCAANPIIPHFGLSPLVADPSVLAPEESHNGKWQLFCHTLFGVYRFESDDGLHFANRGRVLSRAMRPDINYIDGVYYLYYERVQPFVRRMLAIFGKVKWFSEIFIVTSRDLVSWTRSERVIACDRDYERDASGVSISNPFLLEIGGLRRLYFSTGLTYLEDCHFSEPTFISYADSASLIGGFVSRAAPAIGPEPDNPHFNRCSGCIKVYAVSDGYIALQNGIYQGDDGKTHSAVMLLKSPDGEHFEFVKPLITPQSRSGNDWMAQYVYASNLALYGGKLYLYFNARNVADPLRGRESIGLATAEI